MSGDLPLMKNVLTLLGKSILIPLGWTAAGSETDGAIQKKILGSGMAALISLNKAMEDIINKLNLLKNQIHW